MEPQTAIPDYVFTRNGERFTLTTQGVRLVKADGSVSVDIHQDIPADVMAGTVVDLILAGWELRV
jgi:hypothetical protein